MTQNEDGYVRTHSVENIKQYLAYDGSSRLEYVYEARANAANNDPCLVTQYVYSGSTTRVIKMKETVGVWVSATMDI